MTHLLRITFVSLFLGSPIWAAEPEDCNFETVANGFSAHWAAFTNAHSLELDQHVASTEQISRQLSTLASELESLRLPFKWRIERLLKKNLPLVTTRLNEERERYYSESRRHFATANALRIHARTLLDASRQNSNLLFGAEEILHDESFVRGAIATNKTAVTGINEVLKNFQDISTIEKLREIQQTVLKINDHIHKAAYSAAEAKNGNRIDIPTMLYSHVRGFDERPNATLMQRQKDRVALLWKNLLKLEADNKTFLESDEKAR